MSDFDIRNPGSGGPPPLGQPNVAPSGGTAPAGTSRGVGATTNQVDPGVAPRQPAPASQGPTLELASPSSGAALAAFYQEDAAAFEDVISEIRKDLVTADEQEWKSNRQAMMSAFQVVKDKLDDQISELRKSAKDTMAAALFSGIAQIAGGVVSVIGATSALRSGSMVDEEIPEAEQISDVDVKPSADEDASSMEMDDDLQGGDEAPDADIELQPMNQQPAEVEEPAPNQAQNSDADDVQDKTDDADDKAGDEKRTGKNTRKVWRPTDEAHRQAVLARWQALSSSLGGTGTIGSGLETQAATDHSTNATKDQSEANQAQSQFQDFQSFAEQASQTLQTDWQTVQAMLSSLNSVKEKVSA